MISFAKNSRAASLASDAPPAVVTPAGTAARNAALDFTKGGLVLCMVAYHTLNYFRYDVRLIRPVHFVPASFIFITGFLITHVYLPKMHAGDVHVYRRLFVRGLKVLVLFTALNVIIQAIFATSYNRHLGLDAFVAQLDTIFLTGERHAAVFGVLLPIGYLLLLSSVLLRVARVWPVALHVFSAAIFVLCAALAQRDLLTINLDLLSMGLLGMVAGFMSKRHLDGLAGSLTILVIAYSAYFIATRVWYPTYLINTVGVTLSLLLLYALGRRVGNRGLVARQVALVGNYTLLSYLVQIAALQFVFRLSRAFGVLERDVFAPFAATVLITFGVVKIVDRLRARSAPADAAYKFIFA